MEGFLSSSWIVGKRTTLLSSPRRACRERRPGGGGPGGGIGANEAASVAEPMEPSVRKRRVVSPPWAETEESQKVCFWILLGLLKVSLHVCFWQSKCISFLQPSSSNGNKSRVSNQVLCDPSLTLDKANLWLRQGLILFLTHCIPSQRFPKVSIFLPGTEAASGKSWGLFFSSIGLFKHWTSKDRIQEPMKTVLLIDPAWSQLE